MDRPSPTIKLIEAAVQQILDQDASQAFTMKELIRKVTPLAGEDESRPLDGKEEKSKVSFQDMREALWNLYFRGKAEPFYEGQRQFWKKATEQHDNLKNRQPLWKTTAY